MQFNQQIKLHGKRPGDWYCPQCANFNFSFRVKCNRCQSLWRDDPQTQLYQITHEGGTQIQNWAQQQGQASIQVKQDNSNSVSEQSTFLKSNSSTNNSDEEDENQTPPHKIRSPFSQALFVHDLLVDEPPLSSDQFTFYRDCSECKQWCYFYQTKCQNCQHTSEKGQFRLQ